MLPPLTNILALALALTGTLVAAATCDIYLKAGTPCVAAHSTTRALYGAYKKGLYQVQRSSDHKTKDILPVNGIADASAQDVFCHGTDCVISIIYDQSGKGNDLTRAPPGSAAQGPAPNGFDRLANATAAPIRLNGHKVYGLAITPQVGYRNDKTHGIATGDGAQGIYAVLDGTDADDSCCFDYGNAETDNHDDLAGTMEALNFGSPNPSKPGPKSTGAGSGPWIRADLENGLYAGQNKTVNLHNPSIKYRFLTAVLKGRPNHWAIRGGNSQKGSLSTFFDGERPVGYTKMKLQGAIVLGIGGDNSDGGRGTFYEGVMTATYPSDQTEDSVQANILSAKYTV